MPSQTVLAPPRAQDDDEAAHWELQWEAHSQRAARPKTRGGAKKTAARLQNALQTTLWLDAQLGWSQNQVVWRLSDQKWVLQAGDLERTARVFESWLERRLPTKDEGACQARRTLLARREKWRWARSLAALKAPDLEILAAPSRARNPLALAKLADLVVVEALSSDVLTPSPAQTLARNPDAAPWVRALLERDSPREVAILAAMILGAQSAQNGFCDPIFASKNRVFAELGATCAQFWPDESGDWGFVAQIAARDVHSTRQFAALMENPKTTPFYPHWKNLRILSAGLDAAEIVLRLRRALETPDFWPDFPRLETVALDPRAKKSGALKAWRNAHRTAIEAAIPFFWNLKSDADTTRARLFLQELAHFPLRFLAAPTPHSPDEASDLKWATHQVAACVEVGLAAAQQAASHAECGEVLRLLGDEIAPRLRQFAAQKRKNAPKKRPDVGAFVGEVLSQKREFLKLALFCGPTNVRKWKAQNLTGELAGTTWPSREAVELAAFASVDGAFPWLATPVFRHLKFWDSLAQAREVFGALQKAMAPFEARTRDDLWTELVFYAPVARGSIVMWQSAPIFLRELETGPLQRAWKRGGCGEIVRFFADAWAKNPDDQTAILACFVSFLRVASEQSWRRGLRWNLLARVEIAHSLAGANSQKFEWILRKLWVLNEDSDFWNGAQKGARQLRRVPLLHEAFQSFVEAAPRRALERLSELDTLVKCEATPVLAPIETNAVLGNDEWRSILQVDSALAEVAGELVGWRQIAGETTQPPKNARQMANWPASFRAQIAVLEKSERSEFNAAKKARLDNLRARLSDESALKSDMAREIGDNLRENLRETHVSAIEKLWKAAFGARMRFLCGEFPDLLNDDANWRNALLLACEVEWNRKWARLLLRGELARQRGQCGDWRREIVANARFLEKLRAQSAHVERWMGVFEAKIGAWALHLECEPLQILQMGNRFNTCLARGGCNQHSSIANAVDLDKRVVYARDARGHFVGRQLWAVAQNGALVGFTMYSTLPQTAKSERAALQRAFATHARNFAGWCGLELADEGEVAACAVGEWYDDGVCAWKIEAPSRKKKRAARRSKTEIKAAK